MSHAAGTSSDMRTGDQELSELSGTLTAAASVDGEDQKPDMRMFESFRRAFGALNHFMVKFYCKEFL